MKVSIIKILKRCRTGLTNHTRPISQYWFSMPSCVDIHTHTHTHTHTHKHTHNVHTQHTHMHIDATDKNNFKKPATGQHTSGLKAHEPVCDRYIPN